MTMRNEKFEELLSEELARQLEPQRGRAGAAFRAQRAAERVAGGSKSKASWARREVTGRGMWLWMGVPSLLAACLAVVVTPQFVGGPGNGGLNTNGSGVGAGNSGTVAAQVEVTRDKPGAVIVEGGQPMQEMHQQAIRTVEWMDPAEHARYRITEQPTERVVPVPLPKY
jgi:hypothetical protein